MPDWLRGNDSYNVRLTRHLYLHFSSVQYTKMLGMCYPHDEYKGKPSPVGGDLLVETLELLAANHNLSMLEITFAKSAQESSDASRVLAAYNSFQSTFRILFFSDSRIIAALRKIRSLAHLYCEKMPGSLINRDGNDEMETDWEAWWVLRKRMESQPKFS